MLLEPVIAFCFVLFIQNSVKTFPDLLKWEKIFRSLIPAIVALFIVQQIFDTGIIDWVWHLLIIAIIVAGFRFPEFVRFRMIFLAITPVCIISIAHDIFQPFSNAFFDAINKFLAFTSPLATTWMIALLIIWMRQKKTVVKEQELRMQEAEQLRLAEAKKMELESLVAARTIELTQQKDELQHALLELKTTQKQLIQSEKMASLGELTAGIAHEIQNPLNFVNNFSEVNAELISELRAEIDNGNLDEVKAIALDIEANEQKITHHGRRADAIVKGMLQHSRSSVSQKEPTDINALADEYLRLSYHGLRAKDKSFNATFTTDFDETIGKINIIPQDIGRVLLNLINNAFYSVTEKKKSTQADDKKYEPTVSVRSAKVGNYAEIKVRDNGDGIPQEVLDKIYQPFFTTKPTGKGTGLGLSLSYDIIKAHSGELTVDTKEGEFAEFTVRLPINIV